MLFLFFCCGMQSVYTSAEKNCLDWVTTILTFISTGFLIFHTCSDFMLTLPLCSQTEEYVPGPDNQSIPSLQPQQLRDGNEIWWKPWVSVELSLQPLRKKSCFKLECLGLRAAILLLKSAWAWKQCREKDIIPRFFNLIREPILFFFPPSFLLPFPSPPYFFFFFFC